MKLILIMLAAVASFGIQAAEKVDPFASAVRMITQGGAHPEGYAKFFVTGNEGSGPLPVRKMVLLSSDSFQALSPEDTAYRIVATADPLHSAQVSTLLIRPGQAPIHLVSDDQVSRFLGPKTTAIKNREDATRFIQAFADLAGYFIVETKPKGADARKPGDRPALLDTDFKFFAEEHEREWRVYASLLTHAPSGSVNRYVFRLFKSPGSGFDIQKPLLIHLSNYIY